ncbi:MAG TPA: hypothetical protein VFA65_07830 [Bryobacteraceae bacterium]|nr:hypothetical protein [Bryobacteraceae bacterium]
MPDGIKYHLGTKGILHYPMHLVTFVLTGVIFCWNLLSFRSRLVCAGVACCAAWSLEFLEALPHHNRIEWADVLIDCLGVAIGLTIVTVLQGTKVPLGSYENRN